MFQMVSELEALSTANAVIDSIDRDIIARLQTLLTRSRENVELALGTAFSEHLSSTYRRISNIRTILTKDKQESLLTVYVNLNLKSDDELIEDRDIFSKAFDLRRILIQGTGGAGKSMLLKYLVTHSIMKPNGNIPVFIELRSLNFDNQDTLEDLIFSSIKNNGAKESHYIFLKALSEGLVFLYLDGLDEVPNAARASALEKINSFTSRYPKLSIIISSRPGNNRDALAGFDVYNVQPLTRDQAIQVVRKTNADSELKDAFIEKLEGPLFEQHETFLGIPLLVVMMLLTFSSYSEIPDRMSVFYEQAFSTLYAIHDTVSKGPYKREHFAKLAPDEFMRIFEVFCYLSLSKEIYAFLYPQILKHLRDSVEISQLSAEPELVLKDLEESVCLIVRDGINYVFAHRSFQEYFASKFALKHSSDKQFTIIDNCIGNEWQHNTVKLLDEIDPIKFREKWVLPALDEIISKLDELDEENIDVKLGHICQGWHISSEAFGKNGNLLDYSSSYYLVSSDSGMRILKIATALSRILPIDSSYTAFPASALLPSDIGDARRFVDKLEPDVGSARKLLNWLENNDRDSEEGDGEIFSVMIDEDNANWLTHSGIPRCWDRYLDSLKKARADVADKVHAQKRLEGELL